jgi:DNA invertase Pin-like site-specific DNA recombinase
MGISAASWNEGRDLGELGTVRERLRNDGEGLLLIYDNAVDAASPLRKGVAHSPTRQSAMDEARRVSLLTAIARAQDGIETIVKDPALDFGAIARREGLARRASAPRRRDRSIATGLNEKQTGLARPHQNVAPKRQRCAIYTLKSTEQNLDLAFNSLDAQREACEAYIKSQAHEGWVLVRDRFDDGGLSGASLDRLALQELLDRVRARQIDVIVVYKVDRLTRSLADFAKLVELFDEHEASFVSATQSFNTTSSMGRLTLNVLLSFAQFEREVIGERVRDKIAASKRKGLWVGEPVPLGYRSLDKKLEIAPRRRRQSSFGRSLPNICVSARLARWRGL